MDKASSTPANAAPGISIRNGPVIEMEVDKVQLNGVEATGDTGNKRKSRNSGVNRKSYKETSNDEEDDEEKPLV